MRQNTKMILSLMFAFIIVFADQAMAGDWELLGTSIGGKIEREHVIIVKDRKTAFKLVKLKVENISVKIKNLKIFFVDGDAKEVEIRRFIPKGGQSRPINLPKGGQAISKATFEYETRSASVKMAKIELWGKE
jgi:hypothetical protein